MALYPVLCRNEQTGLSVTSTMMPGDERTRFGSLGREIKMLWTVFVVLIVLWLLGLVTSYTMGGFIHILLVLAIVVVLIRVIQGRRAV